MRSRFSAFALGLAPYLLATWHPSTRPESLDLDDVTWRRLQIRGADGAGLLHERSRFVREDGRWFYVDGDVSG
jgi:SEC-C motif domain protein